MSRRAGSGEPVVLIHGLGLSGAIWDRVRDALGPGYRLVAVDLRGAGRTRELAAKELTLGQWAVDLGAVVDELGLERPVLVGHSLGASVALRYALERPDGVRGLVLIAADPNLSNLAPRMLASAERIEARGSRRGCPSSGRRTRRSRRPRSSATPGSSRSTGSSCFETTRPPTSASAGRSPRRRASATGSARWPGRRSSSWATSTTGRCPSRDGSSRADLANATVAELALVGHTPTARGARRDGGRDRPFLERLDGGPGRPGADPARRHDPPERPEGPFGHLDVR